MLIFNELKNVLPEKIIKEIEAEYLGIKHSYYSKDVTSCGIHAARFCELVSALICQTELAQLKNINSIHFNQNIEKLLKSQKNSARDEILKLLIPRVLSSIYTLRNKKKIAHIKEYIPERIDMKYIRISIDWILSQLLLIYCNINNNDVIKWLESISFEEIKGLERFEDGNIIFFDHKISIPNKILISLSMFYSGGRIDKKELFENLDIKNNSSFITALGRLKERRMIHQNNKGIILTKKGIQKAEQIIEAVKESTV